MRHVLRGTAAPRELLLGGDRHQYLRFHCLACELASLAAASYLQSDNLVARLSLPNMAYPAGSKPDIFAQALRGLLTLEPDPERQAKHLDFIDIYAELDDNERRVFERGREQGLLEGEAVVLVRQMERKFSALTEAQRQCIETADAETLLTWCERILVAQSPDEVLR